MGGFSASSSEKYNTNISEYYHGSDELNGWMWEFLRRSKEYRDFNEKAETLKLIFEDKDAVSNEEHQSALHELLMTGTNFFEEASPATICTQHPFNASRHDDTIGLSELKQKEDPDFICIHIFTKMNEWQTWMIPRYNTPYDRFTILSDAKLPLYIYDRYLLNENGLLSTETITLSEEPPMPRIKGAGPFKLFFHNIWDRGWGFDDLVEEWKKDSDARLNEHINNLSRNNHTFTVVISHKTNMRDIETDLVAQIKDIIRGNSAIRPRWDSRKRYDKWKYYLIAYDLIELEKLDPSHIATIFNIAFPQKTKVAYIASDIERYYSEAIKFIEKGKYKEYLFF